MLMVSEQNADMVHLCQMLMNITVFIRDARYYRTDIGIGR